MDLAAPASLPSGWVEARLSDFCQIIQGQSPPGDTYNTSGVGVPFFQGKAEFGLLYAIPRKWCTAPTKMAALDDILISIRAPVGPTNLCPEAACIGRGLAAIRPQGSVPIRYVLYGIHATEEKLAEKATGTTFEAISGDSLRTHTLTLAPLPEQHRIVAEIERQFSLLDAGVANLKRVQANLKRYRAAVLQAACTGQLVPTEAEEARAEGRAYEPADVLLTRILAERRARWEAEQLAKMEAQGKLPLSGAWKAKYQEPSAPDTNGLPELPKGWTWASVASIATKVVDGIHRKPSYVPTGVPFVTVKNLTAGRGISFESLNYITEDDHREFSKRADPAEGDLLISKDGTLGVVRLVKTDRVFSIFVSVAMIKPVLPTTSRYLEVALSSPPVQIQMVPKGSGLQHIHLEDLRDDCIPLPPLKEQERIVAEVERRLSVVDNLEQVVKANLKRAERLRQAVLKEAFAGRLVPQDPDDEPASVLLERIKAEREAQAKAPAKAGRMAARKQGTLAL